jgi:hypothetical protein
MLKGLFAYNPKFRLTAKECLQSPIFDSIRDPHLEIDAKVKIHQPVYAPNTFDYDKNQPIGFNIDKLKVILNQEI